MDRPRSTRQCLQFPAVAPGALLRILDAVAAQDYIMLAQSDLRVARAGALWRIFLPVRPDRMAGGDAAVWAFRDRLKRAYQQQANHVVGREAEQGFAVPTDGLLPPLEAAIILAAMVPPKAPPMPPAPEKMVVVLGSTAQLAPVMADIVRHGRDVRTAGAHRLADGKLAGFMVLTDGAEDYGAVSAYLQRDDLAATVHAMVPQDLVSGRLWLDARRQPPDTEVLATLAAFILSARGAGALARDATEIVCILGPDDSAQIYYHAAKTASAAPFASQTLAQGLEPVQPFAVTAVRLRPDDVAASDLRAQIAARGLHVGYQMSIQPMPRGVVPGVDLEPLRAQIAELELQVAQITALGAPQQRLMRFTDAQLPAMIDGLRRLPPASLMDGSLLYAASHSAGRGLPAHYLAYDPALTHMRVAEARWQAETDPDPIRYWLEPFVAEAQLRRPSRTRVFVPAGHFMVPSLAHFGGDIDETLRLALGRLFEDGQSLLTGPDKRAWYLFTRTDAQDFRLAVEVIDADGFAPLHQQLHWINDYLQVRSPVPVMADKLAGVAAALYDGQVAAALQDDLALDVARLDAAWQEARDRVGQEALGAIAALTAEVTATAERIVDLHAYLTRAARDMAALEVVAQGATAALKGMDAMLDNLSDKDAAMARIRGDFESRVSAEVEMAEGLIAQSEARIAALQDRLERIRTWGDT